MKHIRLVVIIQLFLSFLLAFASVLPIGSVKAQPLAAQGWNGKAYVGLKAPFPFGDKYGVSGDRFTHDGKDRHAVDILLNRTPVLAMFGGTVRYKPNVGGAGNELDIDHGDGYCTAYLHLERAFITSGHVNQGDLIAVSGNTVGDPKKNSPVGFHLHVEVDRMSNGKCNVDDSTPEVPFYFDEIPGRELNKGDQLNSSQVLPSPWVNGKSYMINNATTNLVLDVNGGNTKNETKIIQWEKHGDKNQIWVVEANTNGYYRLHSALSTASLDLCMVVYYASTQDGGKIILNECSRKGQSNEWWRPIKIGNNYFIQNYGSHKVLVVPSGSTVWGTQIIQWAMDAGPGQTWNFIQK